MRFFLVLLGVALAACQCPPEDGTALIPGQDLSNLRPYQTYYICAQQGVTGRLTTTGPTDVAEWNVTSGVWRLRGNQIFVDDSVVINVVWPARVDFVDSFFDSLGRLQNGANNWRGLNVYGAPTWAEGADLSIGDEVVNARRRSVSKRSPSYGDCGNFENVGFDNISDDDDIQLSETSALGLFSCNGRTNVDSIRFFRGYHLLKLTNCSGLVLNDVIATHRPDDSAVSGIVVVNSQVAFNRLFMNHEDDCLEAREGSSVTLCFPFMEEGDSLIAMDPDNKITVGESSSVAIAGPNNVYSDIPGHIEFLSNGGVVYYLKACPHRFAPGYDMNLWTSYVTNTMEAAMP